MVLATLYAILSGSGTKSSLSSLTETIVADYKLTCDEKKFSLHSKNSIAEDKLRVADDIVHYKKAFFKGKCGQN